MKIGKTIGKQHSYRKYIHIYATIIKRDEKLRQIHLFSLLKDCSNGPLYYAFSKKATSSYIIYAFKFSNCNH